MLPFFALSEHLLEEDLVFVDPVGLVDSLRELLRLFREALLAM